MKYIADNKIASKPFYGCFEVDDEKGAELLAAQNAGHKIAIRAEGPRILDKQRRTIYAEDGSRKQIAANDDTPEGYTDEPPAPTEAEQRESERRRILSRLDQIDRESIRSHRAIVAETDVQADHDKLWQLETEAQSLRAELDAL